VISLLQRQPATQQTTNTSGILNPDPRNRAATVLSLRPHSIQGISQTKEVWQSTLIVITEGQFSEGSSYYFKTKALFHIKIYFQQVQGLLRSWMSSIHDSAMK